MWKNNDYTNTARTSELHSVWRGEKRFANERVGNWRPNHDRALCIKALYARKKIALYAGEVVRGCPSSSATARQESVRFSGSRTTRHTARRAATRPPTATTRASLTPYARRAREGRISRCANQCGDEITIDIEKPVTRWCAAAGVRSGRGQE